MFETISAAGRYALACAAAAVVCLFAVAPAGAQPLEPRVPGLQKSLQQMQVQPASRQVILKFREGMQVRYGGGQLTGLASSQAADLASVLTAAGVSTSAISRLHTRSESDLDAERDRAQQLSGRQLADLNLYYLIDLPAGASAADVAARLNALDTVEFAEPARPPSPLPVDIPPMTPDFTANQGYKGAAPTGIGVPDATLMPGTDGAGMQVADVEYSWQMDHEDLELPGNRVLLPAGRTAVDPFNDTNHGTAVMGEIVGLKNAYGITGIAPAAVGYVAPANFDNGYNPAAAISRATQTLVAGDVLVIEQQTPVCGTGNFGPLEEMQAVFDAISTATALGIVVVAAAGNGSVDLDAPGCNNLFNRAVRDSRAIIVGAGSSTDHSRLGFSSFGSRVDVQGWGGDVATTGYGNTQAGSLFDPADIRQRYTGSFSGTSSATPIVSGAVLSIQGRLKACGMAVATPLAMRQTLAATGTPQGGNPAGNNIGPLPRIPEAIAAFNATTCGGGGAPGPLACQFQSRLGDFNADLRADIAMRRADGMLAIYLLNGFQIANAALAGIIGTEWSFVGQGEFSGDGRSDLLFRRTNGTLAIYNVSGTSVVAAQLIGTPGTEWNVVGVGDFNGDGRADILLRRASDGMLLMYQMNGFQIVGAQLIGAIGLEWKVQGVNDLNGDGRADIVMRRTSDGMLAVYLMNGFQIMTGQLIGAVGTEWTMIGVADFNGDNRADLLARRADGALAMYLMNGTQLVAGQVIGAVGAEWSFAGTGDLNGDLRSDLVFRRASDGRLQGYLMNGFMIGASGVIGTVGTEWGSCYGQGSGAVASVSRN